MFGELNIIRAIDISLQVIEIVACMKAVDPVKLWSFAIKPRAVRILALATVQHGLAPRLSPPPAE
jgi:hypothetical protein